MPIPGSIDTVARTLARVIGENDWLSEKMVVVNQPGAGGTIATRRIRTARRRLYDPGLWHQGLVTSKAMGIVDYDHTAFEILYFIELLRGRYWDWTEIANQNL